MLKKKNLIQRRKKNENHIIMEQAINNEYVNKVADMLPSNGKTIDCKFYVV